MNDIENKSEAELVDSIGSTVIGTGSGLKAQSAQAELTRRLILSIRNLDKTTSVYSKIIVALTVSLGALALIQIWIALQQVNYAEVQSRSDRIVQAEAINNAVNLCEKSPQSQQSGLYDPSNGNPAPCSKVLQDYKK